MVRPPRIRRRRESVQPHDRIVVRRLSFRRLLLRRPFTSLLLADPPHGHRLHCASREQCCVRRGTVRLKVRPKKASLRRQQLHPPLTKHSTKVHGQRQRQYFQLTLRSSFCYMLEDRPHHQALCGGMRCAIQFISFVDFV